MKIGLIQSQSIGDIVIALPIAHRFIDQGHQVYWPVNSAYVDFLAAAAPKITFIGIDKETASIPEFFLGHPLARLAEQDCDRFINLYNYLEDMPITNPALANALKFDEYKYAVSGVPFSEKWTLGQHLKRNIAREEALFSRLNITQDYICTHLTGSNVSAQNAIFDIWRETHQIIDITELTDSPFDWIYTLENASKRILLDSVFSNLTDQLNITGNNYLILRSPMPYTPVLKNGWTFMTPTPVTP